MMTLRTLALITIAAAASALGAQTRSYGPLRLPQGSIIASLPQGGLALGISGETDGALLVVDGRGGVEAARTLPAMRPAFLTTTAAGEIYVGPAAQEQWQADRVAKLRRDLSPVWMRRLTAVDGAQLWIRNGAATGDGGIVLVGRRNAASFVAKLAANGNVEWATVVDLSGDADALLRVRPAADGYVAAGSVRGKAWLVRLGRDGQPVWQRTYAPLGSFEALVVNRRGEIVAAGEAQGRPAVAKIAPDGKLLWSRTAATPGSGRAVVETDAGYVAAFAAGPLSSDLELVAVTDDGATLWQRALAGGNREPMLLVDRDASLLAVRGERVAFTVAFGSERVPVVDILPKTGSSDCNWLVSGKLVVHELTAEGSDTPAIEVSAPGMVTESNVRLALAPLAVSAAVERCTATAAAAHDAAPASKEAAFTARDSAAEQKYVELVRTKDAAGLEATANRLLREHASPDPLRPHQAVYAFYRVFRVEATAPEEVRLAAAREWVAAHPRSAAARVALATTLFGIARDRRGSGSWSSVTATGAAAYRQLLSEARDALLAAGDAAHADPQYWWMRITLAAEAGGEDVRDVARQALAIHADPELAHAAAHYLQPEWNGSVREVLAWADEAARLTREKLGNAVYAWLAVQLEDREEHYPFDWTRVKQGFEEAIRKAPRWLPTYHRYARLAKKRDDRAKARELFAGDALAWYAGAESIWRSRVLYDDARAWALEQTAPPPAPAIAAAPSAPAEPAPPQADLSALSGRVYLKVGDTRIPAEVMAADAGGGKLRSFQIALTEKLDRAVDPKGLPVVDARGNVLGVVTARAASTYDGFHDVLDAKP